MRKEGDIHVAAVQLRESDHGMYSAINNICAITIILLRMLSRCIVSTNHNFGRKFYLCGLSTIILYHSVPISTNGNLPRTKHKLCDFSRYGHLLMVCANRQPHNLFLPLIPCICKIKVHISL
jgi:hypothetical protein